MIHNGPADLVNMGNGIHMSHRGHQLTMKQTGEAINAKLYVVDLKIFWRIPGDLFRTPQGAPLEAQSSQGHIDLRTNDSLSKG